MRISDWSSDVCSSDLDAHAVGGHRPAGFGLPPVIDHRTVQAVLGPVHGIGVGAFAGQEQRAELRQVVLPDQLGFRRSDERRAGKEGVMTFSSRWWTYP